MRRFITIIGSFFYTGYFPFASATFASLVWLIAFLFLPHFGWFVKPYSLILTFPVAIYASGEMEKYFGHDSSRIVIDEFVGMQVSLLLLKPDPLVAVSGFVLFRVFDIAKPFPVGRSQKLRGGFGVVVDDVLAGVYSRLVLALIIRFFLK